MQIYGFLLTLPHHKLDPQENVPKVQLISMKRTRHLTRSQVLRTPRYVVDKQTGDHILSD